MTSFGGDAVTMHSGLPNAWWSIGSAVADALSAAVVDALDLFGAFEAEPAFVSLRVDTHRVRVGRHEIR